MDESMGQLSLTEGEYGRLNQSKIHCGKDSEQARVETSCQRVSTNQNPGHAYEIP